MTALSHEYPVMAVSFIAKEVLVAGGDDCFLTVWQWQQRTKLHTLLSHSNSLNFIVQSGSEIITGGGDGQLRRYRRDVLLQEGAVAIDYTSVDVSTEALMHVACLDNQLFISDFESQLSLVRLNSQSPSRVELDLPYYEKLKGFVLISPDRLITIDSKVKLWELKEAPLSQNSRQMEVLIEEI